MSINRDFDDLLKPKYAINDSQGPPEHFDYYYRQKYQDNQDCTPTPQIPLQFQKGMLVQLAFKVSSRVPMHIDVAGNQTTIPNPMKFLAQTWYHGMVVRRGDWNSSIDVLIGEDIYRFKAQEDLEIQPLREPPEPF